MNNTHSESTTASAPRSPGAAAFLVTSLAALVLAMLMLAGRPAFLLTPVLTAHGLAWLEWIVFGCAFSGFFGVAYDALPRSFGIPLFSEKMALLHFGFHLTGLLLVIFGLFGEGFSQAGMGPTFLACGVVVFVVNVAGSLKNMPRPDAAAAFLCATCLWLVITAFLGVPFAAEPPLKVFPTFGWSAGWLVLAVAGVVINGILGLALRVTPLALGMESKRSAAPWWALVFMNAGLAWLFAAVSLAPMPFVIFCAAIYLAGALIYLGAMPAMLRTGTTNPLVWDAKILVAAACMIPVAIGLLSLAASERLAIAPVDPAAIEPVVDAAVKGPLPFNFLAVDGAAVLTVLLGVSVPAIIALIFQLLRIENGLPASEESGGFRARLANQILLAAFFNYAIGVLMVVPASWIGIEQIVSLGSLFLLVGAAGFLGNYLFLSKRSLKGDERIHQAPTAA